MPWAWRGGKDDSNVAPLSYDQARYIHPPFAECYAIQAFSSDEKSLHRHTIPCFASTRSPFELQIGSQETPHASYLETEEERCPRCNQRRAARAVWVRCEPSSPRRDPKTGELARSSRRRAQPFLSSHWRSEGNQACLPGPLCSSSREGVTHSVQVARWARTRSCSRSLILAPNSSESGSPPPSSLAAR